jgi:hypothetical protein
MDVCASPPRDPRATREPLSPDDVFFALSPLHGGLTAAYSAAGSSAHAGGAFSGPGGHGDVGKDGGGSTSTLTSPLHPTHAPRPYVL